MAAWRAPEIPAARSRRPTCRSRPSCSKPGASRFKYRKSPSTVMRVMKSGRALQHDARAAAPRLPGADAVVLRVAVHPDPRLLQLSLSARRSCSPARRSASRSPVDRRSQDALHMLSRDGAPDARVDVVVPAAAASCSRKHPRRAETSCALRSPSQHDVHGVVVETLAAGGFGQRQITSHLAVGARAQRVAQLLPRSRRRGSMLSACAACRPPCDPFEAGAITTCQATRTPPPTCARARRPSKASCASAASGSRIRGRAGRRQAVGRQHHDHRAIEVANARTPSRARAPP